MQDVDQVDLKLLSALQEDARRSIVDLAEEAGTSTASVQRRLKRLRGEGLIKRDVALLDRKKLGYTITAIVAVELEKDSVDQVDRFKRKAHSDRQIQQAYCIAGDADFVLIVVARDIEDYEAFTHRFFFNDKNVRKFRTSIVVSSEKTTLMLPLPIC